MNAIEWVFGKRMTNEERLRKHQRTLDKTVRELDRERTKLEAQERKLASDIKTSAKNGQQGALRVQAKDLVRTKKNIQKFYLMRTQIQAVGLQIQTVRSNEQMMQSMKGATSLLGQMNRQMKLPAMQNIVSQFERETDMMEQRQDMMNDAIDDVMAGDEDEDEEEEVVQRVLDEMGLTVGAGLSEVPVGGQVAAEVGPIAEPIGALGFGSANPDRRPGPGPTMAAKSADDELEARLRNLSGHGGA